MAILDLLKRLNSEQFAVPHPVLDRNRETKRCFLTAVAMQAHCDADLEERERTHFATVAATLGFSADETEDILRHAENPDEETVRQVRDRLIQTKYKYYLIIDLHIMAFQDDVVKGVETEVIQQFCRLLEIDDDELEFLSSLAHAVVTKDAEKKRWWVEHFLSKSTQNPFLTPGTFSHYTSDPD